MKQTFELTPVELHNGVYYKRDDLFAPYNDTPINGGKVRQCIALVENNLELIKRDCNNTIATASSIESPQGLITARVAKEYGLKSILAVGGGTEADKLVARHSLLKATKEAGCEIRAVNKLGYTSVLYSKLLEMQKLEKFFIALFYTNLDKNFDSIISTTTKQTYNLPLDKINTIVVPVGGALMYSGILIGLIEQGWLKKQKGNRCIGIQIANTGRKDTIDAILAKRFFMQRIKYDFVLDPTYAYTKHVKLNIPNTDISLDPIYEAKAYEYAIKNGMLKDDGTCLYWIVGNSSLVREMYK